jgi:hypothetical protein
MMDNNPRRDRNDDPTPEIGKLDRALDAALVGYTAVDPRPGIEERILANLYAAHERATQHSWWRWPAAAALAAVIVLAASLAWRTGKPVQKITTQSSPAPVQADKHVGTQVADNSEPNSPRPHDASTGRRLQPHAVSYPATVVAPALKLDQFPSPQPLSEQEKILARYVANYPKHAALIAQARTEELRRDRAEEMAEAAPAGNQDSEQQNK